MKAPDICERWKWKSPEEIIERLLAEPMKRGVQIPPPQAKPVRDRYYRQARKALAIQEFKQVLRGVK